MKPKCTGIKYGKWREKTDWLDTAARSIEAKKHGNIRGAQQLEVQARSIMIGEVRK